MCCELVLHMASLLFDNGEEVCRCASPFGVTVVWLWSGTKYVCTSCLYVVHGVAGRNRCVACVLVKHAKAPGERPVLVCLEAKKSRTRILPESHG